MTTIEIVKEVLSEKVDISALTPNDELKALGLDSLDLVEVMLSIEDRLNIEFSSDEITKLSTLNDVLKLIEEKTK